jgi:hypothetical protein
VTGEDEAEQLVWYAAYGTNLRRERFACYLAGGQPAGALRAYAGCRDSSVPRAEVGLRFPGRLGFGGESSAWTGAMAFVDPQADGEVWARGYLLSVGQLSDVLAQEIRLAPGRDLAPGLVDVGGRHELGPGRYDVLVSLGRRDGVPVVAITMSELPDPAAPAQAYLWSMAVGLRQTFGLSGPEVAAYLLGAAGVASGWTRDELLEIAATSSRARPARTAAASRAEL